MGPFQVYMSEQGDTIISRPHRVKGFVREHVVNKYGYYIIVVKDTHNPKYPCYIDYTKEVEYCRMLLIEKIDYGKTLLLEKIYYI